MNAPLKSRRKELAWFEEKMNPFPSQNFLRSTASPILELERVFWFWFTNLLWTGSIFAKGSGFCCGKVAIEVIVNPFLSPGSRAVVVAEEFSEPTRFNVAFLKLGQKIILLFYKKEFAASLFLFHADVSLLFQICSYSDMSPFLSKSTNPLLAKFVNLAFDWLRQKWLRVIGCRCAAGVQVSSVTVQRRAWQEVTWDSRPGPGARAAQEASEHLFETRRTI